jgi:hypothetical protein
MQMSIKKKSVSRQQIIVLILLLIGLLPFIYISFFAHPAADDLNYGYKGKFQYFLPTLLGEYLHWNGRYFSNILVLINPIVYDSLLLYRVIPVIIIFVSAWSYFWFIREISKHQVSRVKSLIYALALLLVFLSIMPNIAEGVFWYTGAVTYLLGSSWILVLWSVLLKIKDKNNSVWILAAIILIITGIGFNEINMIIIFLSMAAALLIGKKDKKSRKRYLWLFVIALIFSSVVFFAPGNTGREAYFPERHDSIKSLYFSSLQTIRFFVTWSLSFPLLIASLLYYFINQELSEKFDLFRKSFNLIPVYSSLILLVLIFISVFPAYWSTGILGQHRTVNAVCFLFLIFWFINLTVFYNKFKRSFRIKRERIQPILMLLFIIIFFIYGNSNKLMVDLFEKRHISYDNQMTERVAKVSTHEDLIYFTPIENPPHTLFITDLSTDPNHTENSRFVLFYDIPEKKVVVY